MAESGDAPAAAHAGTEREAADWEACFGLLPAVSRTFALGIAQLESPLREATCAAYLLCRAADTFEDAPGVPPAQKAAWLELLCRDVDAGRLTTDWLPAAIDALAHAASPADLALLRALPQLLRAVGTLAPRTQGSIRRCVQEMATGMAEMQHLMWAHHQDVPTLPSLPALRRYCHYVAGTVGTLLTELFFQASPHLDRERYFELQEHAEPFAQLLQHINILKDVAEDLTEGRCYVPREVLAREGLRPASLVEPAHAAAAARALGPVLASALGQAHAAHGYLERMPPAEGRVRRFLAYSLYFGLETLALALREPGRLLGHGPPLKISRDVVGEVVALLERVVDVPEALAAEYRRRVASLQEGVHPDWPAEVRDVLATWRTAAGA